MDLAGLCEALHGEPPEPFSFRSADGRELPVPHPDFVAVGNRRIVVVGDDSRLAIEPLLIVSLDYKPKKNRRKRTRKRESPLATLARRESVLSLAGKGGTKT